MKTFFLSSVGLTRDAKVIIRSLLRIVSLDTQHQWTFSANSDECDALLVGPSANADRLRPSPWSRPLLVYVGKLNRTGEQSWELHFPLRAAPLIATLNALSRHLDGHSLPSIVPQLRPAVNTRPVVAELQALNLGQERENLSLIIHPAIRIDFLKLEERMFWASATSWELSQLKSEVLRGSRIELRRGPLADPRKLSVRGSLSELIWALASLDSGTCPFIDYDPQTAFQLSSWPHFDPRSASAVQLRIVAALTRSPMTYQELVTEFKDASSDITEVLNAAMLCHLLRSSRKTLSEVHTASIEGSVVPVASNYGAPAPRRPWLLAMLRNAIGVD